MGNLCDCDDKDVSTSSTGDGRPDPDEVHGKSVEECEALLFGDRFTKDLDELDKLDGTYERQIEVKYYSDAILTISTHFKVPPSKLATELLEIIKLITKKSPGERSDEEKTNIQDAKERARKLLLSLPSAKGKSELYLSKSKAKILDAENSAETHDVSKANVEENSTKKTPISKEKSLYPSLPPLRAR